MDEQLGGYFDEYFNEVLRDYLKYPEIFNVTSSESSVILVPNKESELLKKIKIDPRLKNQLLHQIKEFLESKGINAHDIHFYSHGTDIIIKYTPMYLYITEVSLYSNIYSYLSAEDLTVFCNLGGPIQKICDNPIFWIELIKNRFPQFYLEIKGGYNWKDVYLGLLAYEEFLNAVNNFGQFIIDFQKFKQGIFNSRLKNKSDVFYHDHPEYEKYRSYYEKYGRNGYWNRNWGKFINNHPETEKYLILNNLIKFDLKDIPVVVSKMSNISLVKKILLDYPLFYVDFQLIFYNVVDENNVEVLKLLMNHENMKAMIDDESYLEYFGDRIEDGSTLKPEMFELLRTNSNISHSYENYLRMVSHDNIELIDYLITRLPDEFAQNLSHFADYVITHVIELGRSNVL